METIINVLSVVLFLLPPLGLIAAAFLWKVYLSDEQRPRSWVLFRLASGASVVAVGSVVIAVLASLRFAGVSLQGLGSVVLVIVVIVMEAIPIWYAASVWRIRRNRNSSSPAPFGEAD